GAAATGSDYEDLLEDRVLQPLGLQRTSLPRGVRLPRPRMSGYDREPDGAPVDVTELIAAGYAWASGGVVSTPADQNRFIRGYVGGSLFDRRTQTAQFAWRSDATSEPPGPGANDAGLAVFRYRTGCGTVYGHTGNTPGYTQFLASSRDGRRSVVVAVNRQTTPDVAPAVFRKLRRVFALAVCAAYAE
ncbi:MAG TPA: serine hydrolase domain-containing protein, partial [Nocardioidaceae bacterium]|nr:serine hydrolase domain-containing protein [Nocardioidaceae bacterium]